MTDKPIHWKAQKRPKAMKRQTGHTDTKQTETEKASTRKAETGKLKLRKNLLSIDQRPRDKKYTVWAEFFIDFAALAEVNTQV
jgi:hypothetical protein